MKIKLTEDRVLCKEIEEDNITASGLILSAKDNKNKPIKAKVIAAGAGAFNTQGGRNEMEVEAGDIVLVSQYMADKVTLEGEEYFIIKQGNIIAVLEWKN